MQEKIAIFNRRRLISLPLQTTAAVANHLSIMGRVSRKRKIKQCDPFYKGKQGSGSANYDLPPDHTSKRKKLRRKKILSDSAIEREVLGKCIVSDSTV